MMALYLSNPQLIAGGGGPQPSPALSLGRYISTSEIECGALGAIFSPVAAAQSAQGGTDYRCVFLSNDGNALTNVRIWIESALTGGGALSVGLDATPPSVVASGTIQAVTVATGATVPADVAFLQPTEEAPLLLVSLPVGYCVGLWLRRSWAAMTGPSTGGATLVIE